MMNNMIFTALFVSMLLGAQSAVATDIPDAASPEVKLYAARCAVCHALPHPKRLDWTSWRHMLHVMKRRMQECGMQMRPEEWRRIAGYLKHHVR